MKTSVKELDYDLVAALPPREHILPKRPNLFFRSLIRGLSALGLMETHFTYSMEGMDKIEKGEPCLILMNHSCFLDLMIASRVFYPRDYCIICTSDGFVGMHGWMEKLMRAIGCVPTQKFVTDLRLVQDLEYCLKTLKTSVLMYPEASYSFDGTATPLPRKMGVLLKKLGVSVVMVETFGAFSRNPLYNELKVRKSVPVSARVRCLYTKEEIRELSKRLGLKTWDKQSFACLSSRFVYGETIDEEKLHMVDEAEQLLLDMGFHQVRVRIHGTIARIEILPFEFEKILQEDIRKEVYEKLQSYGFTYVALDLMGYRTGSMNETLDIARE